MKNIESKYELIIGAVVILAFIFLQPKLSAWLFPFKREMIWNEFQQKVKTNNAVDAKTFWQFREFYYPGYFKFERLGFDQAKTNEAAYNLHVELLPEASASAFLIYNAGKLHSLEALVNTDNLSKTLRDSGSNRADVILDDTSNLMYLSPKKARIIFIKPISEMVKANGYYDYKDPKDSALIDGKYWLSVSEVDLD